MVPALTVFAERDRKLAEARERRSQMRQRVVTGVSVECQRVVTERSAIDFAAVKSLVSIVAVLKLLGIDATKVQHRGACALHGSTRGTARCFSANLEKNVYQCFKCGQSGNALELWSKATKLTPYDAALDLCKRLAVELPILNASRDREEEPVISGSLQ